MLPFMKLLPHVPELVALIEAGWTLTVERVDAARPEYRYQVGAKKDWEVPKIIFAAATLEEAVVKFVINIDHHIKDKQ